MKKSLKIISCILLSLTMILAAVIGRQTVVKADVSPSAESYEPITGDEFDRAYNPVEIKNNYKLTNIEQEEGWISRKPAMASAAYTSNPISGITIMADTKSTGMGSWTPDTAYNLVERSSDWISFFTTNMKDLKAGDVIVWEDDLLGGALFNHIAIIVEVASDFSWYLCADGNCPVNADRPTGIDFVLRTTLQKKGSSSGHVCIWRNTAHGEDIAKSAELYTETVIKNQDMSFSNEYNSIGWGWCYCYVVEMLLATQDAEGRRATQIANERFSDIIDRTAAIYKPVQWAADCGIVNGFEDGTFRPEENCTRAQFVIMLWRMMGRPDAPYVEDERNFSDVSEDLSYYKAIRWASNAGIIKGYNDGTFKPDDALTRGNIVTMIWRLNEKPEGESYIIFSDVDRTDPCYRPIRWAAAVGLVKGFADGTFGSANNCTRAQLAIILYRGVNNYLLEVVPQADQDDSGTVPEPPAGDDSQNSDGGYYDEYGNYHDAYGGYYDSYGNYHDANGGYYDPYGNYHDGYGGYYDPYGNYHYYDDDVDDNGDSGYYDDYGNYYDGSGGYYDPYGNYYDGNGGYYDIYGNYHYEDGSGVGDGGYYDDYGNYYDGNGGYYDIYGNYHVDGGYYDEDGYFHSYDEWNNYGY